MSFQGASINRLNGGIGRTADTDRAVCVIIGATKPTDLAYNKPYELLDITTVEDLGITAGTDDTNSELTYYQLSEMFRLAPDFTFHLIMVEKSKGIADLVADDELKAAVRSIDNVNVLGIAGLQTMASDSLRDAPRLQGLVNDFEKEFIYIDGVFVEGVGNAVAGTVGEYNDNRSLNARSVYYVIAQDPAVAALKSEYNNRAALGTVLGSVAVRRVHEDLGSVDIEAKPRRRRGEENYSLSSERMGYWLSAALSDGTPFNSLNPAEQKSLSAKGWIYVGAFANYPGFYLNGCPACVSKDNDYAYFNFNCIWNKAARIIRQTLIPRIRSKVPTDSTTGAIKSTWVAGAESAIKEALQVMVSAGNIDDCDIYIDAAQMIGEDSPLRVQGQLVVGQVVHEFNVDLGLTNKL